LQDKQCSKLAVHNRERKGEPGEASEARNRELADKNQNKVTTHSVTERIAKKEVTLRAEFGSPVESPEVKQAKPNPEQHLEASTDLDRAEVNEKKLYCRGNVQ